MEDLLRISLAYFPLTLKENGAMNAFGMKMEPHGAQQKQIPTEFIRETIREIGVIVVPNAQYPTELRVSILLL